jgi:DNA-binding NarL/FixJ family response regulator
MKLLIERMPDVEVVGEAGDGLELLNLLKELAPDMAIIDIAMPNLRGIEAVSLHFRRGRWISFKRGFGCGTFIGHR